MGSDNLFHRRKAKQARELARRQAKRESYARVLIVCEGEKTEPFYFNALKDFLELNSTNIVVTGDCGSDPNSVVDYALQQFRLNRDAGDPFDKVFCVFDKDMHHGYEQAIQRISAAKPKDTFSAITSVPCFEYWLLLHFVYTTRMFERTGTRSACDVLIHELHNYLPDYQKGDKAIFDKIIEHLPRAKAYSIRSLQESHQNHNDNPSTKIHILVEYLENIKN